MYSVDSRDSVVALENLPQSSIGAPLPAVVAVEGALAVAYLVETPPEPGWDGRTVRVVGPATSGERVALVACRRPAAHFFGPPNDEAFQGHPLAERGLGPYGAWEVRNSSWIRELERRNRVHSHHDPARYEGLRHFILSFHDSTFECVAEAVELVAVREGALVSVTPELLQVVGLAAAAT